MQIVFEVQNLKCGGCASTIQNELLKLNGVESVLVDPDPSLVTVNVKDDFDRLEAIDRLKAIGYPIAGNRNNIGSKAKSYVSCMTGKLNTETKTKKS